MKLFNLVNFLDVVYPPVVAKGKYLLLGLGVFIIIIAIAFLIFKLVKKNKNN